MNRKTLLLAQVFITFMMAASMSGIMSLIMLGPTPEWLHHWPRQFIMAWPIAFVLTQAAGPIGFALAHRLTGKRA